jgi:hypothetical protein
MPNVALPLFIMTILLLIFLIASGVFKKILLYLGILSEDKEIEVNENLGTYFNCLSNKNRKGWLVDEFHMRKVHDICILSEDMVVHCKEKH